MDPPNLTVPTAPTAPTVPTVPTDPRTPDELPGTFKPTDPPDLADPPTPDIPTLAGPESTTPLTVFPTITGTTPKFTAPAATSRNTSSIAAIGLLITAWPKCFIAAA